MVQTRVYLDAVRWPFHQDSSMWMQWNYHKALATAAVMKAFREGGLNREGGKLGTIINVESVYPEVIQRKIKKRQRCMIYFTIKYF